MLKIAFFSLIFSLLAFNTSLAKRSETYVGVARLSSGELFYTENHRIEFTENRPTRIETIYKDKDNNTIGSLKSDLSFDPYYPPHEFEDIPAKRKNSVEYVLGKNTLRLKNSKPGRELDERVIIIDELKTCAQGAFFFIQDNLSQFLNDEIRTLRFVVPPKLTHYGFRIRPLVKNEEKKIITLRVEIDNWLFRLFAPSIEVDVNTQNGRPVEYRGASNLLGAENKVKTVTIEYIYK